MNHDGYERTKQAALNYVACMKVGNVPGRYKKEHAETEAGLYGSYHAREELRDDDPARTHIMLGSWFYPLSIALVAHMLGDTGYEGPYKLNPMSLHECNVGCPTTIGGGDA